MQVRKETSKGSTLALKTRADITSKTVPLQKRLMSSKILKINKKSDSSGEQIAAVAISQLRDAIYIWI